MPVTMWMCTTCGSIYKNQEFAEYCERTELPPTEIKIGDVILIGQRYGEPARQIVRSIEVASTMLCHSFASWEPNLAEAIPVIESTDLKLHERIFIVDIEIQLGKEWWTKRIPESSVIRVDNP